MLTNVKVIIGGNYGDEGKGLATDYFASKPRKRFEDCIVVLSNGGSQRGHTVTLPNGKRHVFRHYCAGTFAQAFTYLPKYYIVNPMNWMREYRKLSSTFIPRLMLINKDCKLSTPFDMIANQLIENARCDQRHGSCGVGIWETILRDGITVGEMYLKKKEERADYLRFVRDDYFCKRISNKGIKLDSQLEKIVYDDNLIKHYISDFDWMMSRSVFEEDDVLDSVQYVIFENGQGLMLDQDIVGYGKSTTPSSTGLKNPAEMISNMRNDTEVEVCYVTRPYITRHGVGRFDEEYQKEKIHPRIIDDQTNKWNQFQGDLRYGVFDREEFIKRVDDDFNSYAKPNWKKSIFFTHVNEAPSYMDDLIETASYTSDGFTRNSVTMR